jgi:hypothetical protein
LVDATFRQISAPGIPYSSCFRMNVFRASLDFEAFVGPTPSLLGGVQTDPKADEAETTSPNAPVSRDRTKRSVVPSGADTDPPKFRSPILVYFTPL